MASARLQLGRPFLAAVGLMSLNCTGLVSADGDAGSMPSDSGLSPDAATLTSDAGRDAGTPLLDAGHDAGSLQLDAGPSSTRVTEYQLGTTTAPAGFYEYLPPGYDGTAPAPLLVFRHGIGENGNGTTDLPRILVNGNPVQLAAENKWPNSRPFIVLSPQHSGSGCHSAQEGYDFLTWAFAHYSVDPKQVYLTGLSCGAIGTWAYLGTYTSSVVAAAVLLSGADDSNAWGTQGCKLATLAIWSFHGDQDPIVAFAPDYALNNQLQACPQPRSDVQFTRIPDGGHGPWTPIYDLSAGYGDIYAWMLQNAKP